MGMGGNVNGFMGMGGNGNRNSPSRTPLAYTQICLGGGIQRSDCIQT